MKIIVDTSVIIDYTRANIGSFNQLISDSRSGNCDLYIPSVVITELWSGKETKNKKNGVRLEKILSLFKIINLDQKIAKHAGTISRDTNIFGFDAIIAATALELDAQVATSNTKHFTKVKNLKLYSSKK
ncbi:MAG: PIN domain-containing protein [bacterium]|nr:MAG: PIN domain-containing protein [bacterium]